MAKSDDQDGERQAADRMVGLHPIGQALRATYDADNHDTLGGDLTGLMLELARLGDPGRPPVVPPTAHPPTGPRSWLLRLLGHRPA